MIEGTLMAWVEAITHGRVFDQTLDAQRFQFAFRSLTANFQRWPTPTDFMDHLPPRREVKALPSRCDDPARSQAIIESLTKAMGSSGRQGPAEPIIPPSDSPRDPSDPYEVMHRQRLAEYADATDCSTGGADSRGRPA